jgi:hypothetical protein
MKRAAIIILVLAVAGGLCYAEDKFCVMEKTTKHATEPVGAVVETAGVFVGKIASAVEIATTGERKITVENETGECKIFPFCQTTKIADNTFHAVTFDKLKSGEEVKVEYAKEGGVEKAKKVVVENKAQK